MSTKGGPLAAGLPPKPSGTPPPRPTMSLRDRIGDRVGGGEKVPGSPGRRPPRRSPPAFSRSPRGGYREPSPGRPPRRRDSRERDDGYHRYRSPPRDSYYGPRDGRRTPEWDRRDSGGRLWDDRDRGPDRGRFDYRGRDFSPPRVARPGSPPYRDRSPYRSRPPSPPRRGPPPRGPIRSERDDDFHRRSRSPRRRPISPGYWPPQRSPQRSRRRSPIPSRRRSPSPGPRRRTPGSPRERSPLRSPGRMSPGRRRLSRPVTRSRSPPASLPPTQPKQVENDQKQAVKDEDVMDIDLKEAPSIPRPQDPDTKGKGKQPENVSNVQPYWRARLDGVPPTGPRALNDPTRPSFPSHLPTQPRADRTNNTARLGSRPIKKESPRSPEPNSLGSPQIKVASLSPKRPSSIPPPSTAVKGRSSSPSRQFKLSKSPPGKDSPLSPPLPKATLHPLPPATSTARDVRAPPQEPRGARITKQAAAPSPIGSAPISSIERKPSVTEQYDFELAAAQARRKALQTSYVTIAADIRRAAFESELAEFELMAAESRRKVAYEHHERMKKSLTTADTNGLNY